MIAYESGPWHLFEKLRGQLGIEHDESGEPIQWPDTVNANLVICVWCLSVWVAAYFVLFYLISPAVMRLVAMPLAISAGAVLIERLAR